MEAEQTNRMVHAIISRTAIGDSSRLAEAISDDVCCPLPGNWSWSGSWTPKETVLEALLRSLAAQIRDHRSEADLILAEGDRVVVQASASATTVRGDIYAQTYCFMVKLGTGTAEHRPETSWNGYRSTATATDIVRPN